MSIFTAHKNALHDATATTFGEVASWTPLAGGSELTEKVNYNRPDVDDAILDLHRSEWEFTAADAWFEYRAPQFPGLKESVDSKAREIVTIVDHAGDPIGTFRVTKIKRMWDGDTFRAKIEEVAP